MPKKLYRISTLELEPGDNCRWQVRVARVGHWRSIRAAIARLMAAGHPRGRIYIEPLDEAIQDAAEIRTTD